jgi:hypothetical protein
MKKFLTILILSISFLGFCQQTDTLPKNKFNLGLSFSPDYNYRVIKAAGADAWMKEIYDTLEVPKFGYSFGANLFFNINEKFFIGTGVFFADRGEKTKNYNVEPVSNYSNHYYYLEVPAKAQYYLLAGKVKFFISAGFSANIFLGGHSTVKPFGYSGAGDPVVYRASKNTSRLGLSTVLGLGLDCPVSHRWYIRLEPTFKRALTPLADGLLKRYFYSAGFNIGLFYRL